MPPQQTSLRYVRAKGVRRPAVSTKFALKGPKILIERCFYMNISDRLV